VFDSTSTFQKSRAKYTFEKGVAKLKYVFDSTSTFQKSRAKPVVLAPPFLKVELDIQTDRILIRLLLSLASLWHGSAIL
jgi:hypothetical protein